MPNKKNKKDSKRLVIIFMTTISLLGILFGSVYNDWKQILANRKRRVELNDTYETLLENEEKLSMEIARLEDSEGLIDYARENFLLSTDGDIIIKWDKKSTNND